MAIPELWEYSIDRQRWNIVWKTNNNTVVYPEMPDDPNARPEVLLGASIMFWELSSYSPNHGHYVFGGHSKSNICTFTKCVIMANN